MYEAVIGLEVHAQLATQTKIFCSCPVAFGAPPNTHVCPVCLGLPGALPMLNAEALRLAVLAARTLNAEIHQGSRFARKHYFYPDLPKGYQITQASEPFALGGSVVFEVEGAVHHVPLTRLHMEEDAGKTLHDRGQSRVDLNRAGVPLVEIVGEPCLRSAKEASAYLRALREALMFAGVCDGDMEKGNLRCDANVSVRRKGAETFGTRVELKNINSFRFVEKALQYEISRQIDLCESGQQVARETRGFDDVRGTTFSMRGKEESHDYRYFNEPDLPSVAVPEVMLIAPLGESVRDRYARYLTLGLSESVVDGLMQHPGVAAYFDDVAAQSGDSVRAANFIASEVLGGVHMQGLSVRVPVDAARLGELVAMLSAGEVTGKQAKELYRALLSQPTATARELAAQHGWSAKVDEAALRAMVLDVVAAHPGNVASYRAGKVALFGFFMGQVLKKTEGRGDPTQIKAWLLEALGA